MRSLLAARAALALALADSCSMGAVTQVGASAVTSAEALTACAWESLPKS